MYVNRKMIPVKTIPGMVGREKENGDMIYSNIIRTFVNTTMYSHPAQ
jgi:hypothetical protein